MDPARALDTLPPGTAATLSGALESGEEVTHAVPAIGCTIALTTRRLIIIRDGSAFRPKSGVRTWGLDDDMTVRTGLLRHGTGSVVVHWDRNATSVFVLADHWDDAIRLVAAARLRARRGGARDKGS